MTLRGRSVRLGLVSLLFAAGGAISPLGAQVQNEPLYSRLNPSPSGNRLTVRPHAIVGTRAERAGEFQLEAPNVQVPFIEEPPAVYVPRQCVGTRQCPLVVFVWAPWKDNMEWVGPMADKYGMILLGTGLKYFPRFAKHLEHLDALLKQVLPKFAIDPDKIAIMGTCATGGTSVQVGGDNLAVFSRSIGLSPVAYPQVGDMNPPKEGTEFLVDAGLDESGIVFRMVQDLRNKGHQVTHAFGFRSHGHQVES